MPHTTIQSLRPNVTREQAMLALKPRGILKFFPRYRRSDLRRIADVYLPYRLYQVRVGGMRDMAAERTRLFALDAVAGTLDLFEFPRIPARDDFVSIESRNRLEPLLEESRGRFLLAEKVLRIIFQQGFFRVKKPTLELNPVPLEFHMPYWLGFYGEDGALRCRVLDAVRHRVEGAKARALFEHWLAA
jgi:hypothetical protein